MLDMVYQVLVWGIGEGFGLVVALIGALVSYIGMSIPTTLPTWVTGLITSAASIIDSFMPLSVFLTGFGILCVLVLYRIGVILLTFCIWLYRRVVDFLAALPGMTEAAIGAAGAALEAVAALFV